MIYTCDICGKKREWHKKGFSSLIPCDMLIDNDRKYIIFAHYNVCLECGEKIVKFVKRLKQGNRTRSKSARRLNEWLNESV